jgi:hypothetical protein
MVHGVRRGLVAGWVVLLTGAGCQTERQGTAGAPRAVAPATAPAVAEFPIMSWELPPRSDAFMTGREELKKLADCGFTVAAFVQKEQLAECRRLGMRAMVRPASWKVKWHDLSDAQIDERVRQLVDGTQDDPTVMGYFLTDEPGVQEFAALGKAVAAVKRLAPGKLAYINLYPNYATLGAPNLSQLGTASYDDYLARYATDVRPQFISYDNYRVQFSNDLQDAGVAASYFENLMQVRRAALAHGLPWWNIVSSNQIRPKTPPPSPANLQLQAYTTLAAGGQGVTWFTYFGGKYGYGPVDQQGRRTASWSYLRMVNEQVRVLGPVMRGLKSTGVYFSSPAPGARLPALPGNWVEGVGSPSPVMVGEFAGADSERYVMVVNLSLERSAKVQVRLRAGAAGELQQVSPVDGSLLPVESGNAFWLTAGQGALLKVPG